MHLETATVMYFVTASVLLTLAPGPDILYLITKSLSDGARSGIVLACGLVSGIAFHTMLVMLGVAALISSSPTALSILKYVGAAYLLYLAFGAFRSSAQLKLGRAGASTSMPALYRRGVLMNVLNPKVLLFFLAFLPQFISVDSDWSASAQIAAFGLIFAVQGLAVFSIVSVCAARLRRLITSRRDIGKIFGRVEGGVLTLIALGLLLS